MAVTDSQWLFTSDVVREVAFRIDVPEQHRGRWVLSYLPTYRRLSKEEAFAGLVLAEMIFIGLLRPGGEFDTEVAALHAGMIGLTVTDAMCLLALREARRDREPRPDEEDESTGSRHRSLGRCHPTTPTREPKRPGRESIR
ncbi:hypothetical protein [Nocardia seriolae]|uniref:Uncharacterized protein n=1 Tax=Nocardia seriolae TaxID=37332 RepID=A0A0B8NF61_9NOCA|nr:hypothetical protein [Nocardia seriolae]APA94306.1 hypothetical protein NS506_00219 [Nocardia seriolae]MTJ60477.1 hypothetical protein [Nocardia seriolae]MTJ72471.1 hypothetical protein [Nocardia seriolae]MTJ84635.1 hypothetical protein [Nocardia seriolae]MTK28623.1 hypothetical protein [Nocardia seriolae]